MMKIRVQENYFSDAAQARNEIESRQLHAVEMKIPPVHNQSHWHDFSTRIYVLDGELNITDTKAKQTFTARAGSLVEVPERVLHAEQSSEGYLIIAGMSENPAELQQPVDRHPDLL